VLYLAVLIPLPPRRQYLLAMVAAAVLIVPVLAGGGTLARQIAALGSAVLFPVLAVCWLLDRWRNIRPNPAAGLMPLAGRGIAALAATSALSLAGGIYLGAILGDIRFLLEIEIFRGVKITSIAPLLLVTLVYMTRFSVDGKAPERSLQGIARQMRSLAARPATLGILVLLGLAVGVAWVYVGRTGHTAGVPVPALEVKLRYFLEDVMYARPREKEFLIGHPAFLLLPFAVWHGWPRLWQYFLLLFVTIGQGSMVESFAHIRTPVMMSFIRGLDGLALGIPFGLAAILVYAVCRRLARGKGQQV